MNIILEKANYPKVIFLNRTEYTQKTRRSRNNFKDFEKYFGTIHVLNKKNSYDEKKFLSISSKKIFLEYKFKNIINFNALIKLTCEWYDNFYKSNNMIEFTTQQITYYNKYL